MIALSDLVSEELLKFADAQDFDAVDEIANKQLFSTRDQQQIAGGVGFQARNVLTFVDKLDQKVKGVRDAYDFLSEFCHPNGSGHLFTYGEMNKVTGDVLFYETAPRVRNIQTHVMACFMLLLFVEPIMNAFDHLVEMVAELDFNEGTWVLPQNS